MELPEHLQEWLDKGHEERKDIDAFLKRAWKQKNLDQEFHKAHEEAFKKINCLDCGNCCKTTSPIFRDADVRRISKNLRMKEKEFISKYLKIDEENDYVLQKSPCAFLADDNSCGIYDFRPLACKEYPHTNRKNMYQIVKITRENTKICPAVAKIVLSLKA